MNIFRRKENRLYKLLEEFLQNSGELFAKHQMREQADNTLRIRLLERNENRKEKLYYLNHKASIMPLNEEEIKERDTLEWFFEKYLESE